MIFAGKWATTLSEISQSQREACFFSYVDTTFKKEKDRKEGGLSGKRRRISGRRKMKE
jgi:hypothetical protein